MKFKTHLGFISHYKYVRTKYMRTELILHGYFGEIEIVFSPNILVHRT
jgi:hypothetical protein